MQYSPFSGCYRHIRCGGAYLGALLKGWTLVFVLGPGKWLAKLLAPFAYPFIDKNLHPIWGVRDTTDLSYWNIAFRNSAHNLWTKAAVDYLQKANTPDYTLERINGFQWRYRESWDGKYVSFRVTWGKTRKSKGKREFYAGWTMDESRDYMRLTFFQLRPF